MKNTALKHLSIQWGNRRRLDIRCTAMILLNRVLRPLELNALIQKKKKKNHRRRHVLNSFRHGGREKNRAGAINTPLLNIPADAAKGGGDRGDNCSLLPWKPLSLLLRVCLLHNGSTLPSDLAGFAPERSDGSVAARCAGAIKKNKKNKEKRHYF